MAVAVTSLRVFTRRQHDIFIFCSGLLLLLLTAATVTASDSVSSTIINPASGIATPAPVSEQLILGIHLDDEKAVMSVYREGRILIIPNAQNSSLTPPYVAFTSNDTILIGQPAIDYMKINPHNVIHSLRSLLNVWQYDSWAFKWMKQRNAKFQLRNRTNVDRKTIEVTHDTDKLTYYSPTNVMTIFLTHLKSQAESYFNHTVNITGTCINMPSGEHRFLLKDALRDAGMPLLRWIEEPVAAVIAYNDSITHGDRVQPESYDPLILVYDVTAAQIRTSQVSWETNGRFIVEENWFSSRVNEVTTIPTTVAKMLFQESVEKEYRVLFDLSSHEDMFAEPTHRLAAILLEIKDKVIDVFVTRPHIECVQVRMDEAAVRSVNIIESRLMMSSSPLVWKQAMFPLYLKFAREDIESKIQQLLKEEIAIDPQQTSLEYKYYSGRKHLVSDVILVGELKLTKLTRLAAEQALVESEQVPGKEHPRPRFHTSIKSDEAIAYGTAKMAHQIQIWRSS